MKTAFTAFVSFLKVAWPIISMLLGAWSAAHANASRVEAQDGSMSISDQAVHVAGAGVVGAGLMLAGATGVVSNHRAAASAPSVAQAGVDPVLHQLDVVHSAMIAAQSSDEEFDGLNELVKLRSNRNKPANATTTRNTT